MPSALRNRWTTPAELLDECFMQPKFNAHTQLYSTVPNHTNGTSNNERAAASPPYTLNCGIDAVDAIIGDHLHGNGLPRGSVFELVGDASSGKSQVAYGLIADSILKGGRVVVFDTRNRFVAKRLFDVAVARLRMAGPLTGGTVSRHQGDLDEATGDRRRRVLSAMSLCEVVSLGAPSAASAPPLFDDIHTLPPPLSSTTTDEQHRIFLEALMSIGDTAAWNTGNAAWNTGNAAWNIGNAAAGQSLPPSSAHPLGLVILDCVTDIVSVGASSSVAPVTQQDAVGKLAVVASGLTSSGTPGLPVSALVKVLQRLRALSVSTVVINYPGKVFTRQQQGNNGCSGHTFGRAGSSDTRALLLTATSAVHDGSELWKASTVGPPTVLVPLLGTLWTAVPDLTVWMFPGYSSTTKDFKSLPDGDDRPMTTFRCVGTRGTNQPHQSSSTFALPW